MIIALTFLFVACNNNNKNTNSGSNDSSIMNSPASGSAPDTVSNAKGATGTTGTGTVSDSGNATNPGSDTTYHKK